MGKLLSWVVLIALVWLVIRLFAISQRRRQRSGDAGASAGASSPEGAASASRSSRRAIEGEPIVPCAQCGLFVPASDVVHDGGFDYCSAAHRDAHRAQRDAHRRDERR